VPAASGTSALRQRYARPLFVLLGVVALVLLLACANIATVLLARATARRHELSVRLALGASRWHVARQQLVESLLLAAIGAGLGLVFARWGSHALVAQLSTAVNRVILDTSLNWRVAGFTAAVALLTALLFGTLSGLTATRVAPIDAIKEQARGVVGDSRHGLSAGLVAAQVALSLMLVTAKVFFCGPSSG
jgi:ABC-type antimicrobial peptide transport system permease subunit